MLFVPIGQHLIGGARQFAVVFGQGCIDHGQFMGIGANRLDIAFHGDQAVGCAHEFIAQPLDQGLHRLVLPQVGMPAARAKIGQA